jgi:hypothetical protein
LISTSVIFISPLVYKTNKEAIDHYIAQATDIVNQQSKHVRDVTTQQASRAAETTKAYAADYSSKAQELIGNARGRSTSPTAVKSEPTLKQDSAFKSEDFPAAPKEDFKAAPKEVFPAAPKDVFNAPTDALKHDDPLNSA